MTADSKRLILFVDDLPWAPKKKSGRMALIWGVESRNLFFPSRVPLWQAADVARLPAVEPSCGREGRENARCIIACTYHFPLPFPVSITGMEMLQILRGFYFGRLRVVEEGSQIAVPRAPVTSGGKHPGWSGWYGGGQPPAGRPVMRDEGGADARLPIKQGR
jgi:hypothetical protein